MNRIVAASNDNVEAVKQSSGSSTSPGRSAVPGADLGAFRLGGR